MLQILSLKEKSFQTFQWREHEKFILAKERITKKNKTEQNQFKLINFDSYLNLRKNNCKSKNKTIKSQFNIHFLEKGVYFKRSIVWFACLSSSKYFCLSKIISYFSLISLKMVASVFFSLAENYFLSSKSSACVILDY